MLIAISQLSLATYAYSNEETDPHSDISPASALLSIVSLFTSYPTRYPRAS